MAVLAIRSERGGNAAVWICWTSLLFWTPAFNLKTAGPVQGGPFQSRVWHWPCFSRDHVSDTELMLGMSGRANRDAHHTQLGIEASEHQRVALVLMTNLIERSDQPDSGLYGYYLARVPPARGQVGMRLSLRFGGENSEIA
jgi:hypothetical protein